MSAIQSRDLGSVVPPPLPSSSPPQLDLPAPSSPLSTSPAFPPKPPRLAQFPAPGDAPPSPAESPTPSSDAYQTPPESLQLPLESTTEGKTGADEDPSTAPGGLPKPTAEDPAEAEGEGEADVATAGQKEQLEEQASAPTVLFRRASLRLKEPGSTLKRAVSQRVDRIGSALSRFLDRDKSPVMDRERPKSMSTFEINVQHRAQERNGLADDSASPVPYGSSFLRRSVILTTNPEQEVSPVPRTRANTRDGAERPLWNARLAASLACAACARFLAPPIEQCARGHNVCVQCRRRAHRHRCPRCHARFSGVRNLLAEDVARQLLFPCVHTHAGCTRQVPNEELELHERRCAFRLLRCLISTAGGGACQWEGRRAQLEEHVRSRHARYFSAQETTRWRWSPNLQANMQDFQLLRAHGQLFWYCAAQEPERQRVCWFVQHIGYDAHAYALARVRASRQASSSGSKASAVDDKGSTDTNTFSSDTKVSSTDIKSSSTNIKSSSSDIKSSSTDTNASYTDIKSSSTNIKSSSTDIKSSSTDTNAYYTDIKLFSTDIKSFPTDTNASYTDIKSFSTDIKSFSTNIKSPSTDIKSSSTDAPCTDMKPSSTDDRASSADPDTPTTFVFRVTLDPPPGDRRRLAFECSALPDYSPVSAILESGRCLDLSYRQALSFAQDDDAISFSVTILREDAVDDDGVGPSTPSDSPDSRRSMLTAPSDSPPSGSVTPTLTPALTPTRSDWPKAPFDTASFARSTWQPLYSSEVSHS